MSRRVFLGLFLLIFALGIGLRFYQLGSVPGSLEWDELSFGYNAYSVLHIGKDEYGVSYPMAFRAFGEYKQPVYLYLDVVSIAIFGLNAFAVRFPSALFGAISIIFVYLLTFEIFRKYKFAQSLSLLSMFFFAVSPWSLQFSRGAFEANVSLSFVIAAVWLFLKGLNLKKIWYLFGGTALLILSTYTYISQKLIAPLLFITLVCYGFSYFRKRKVFTALLIIFFLIGNFLWLLDTKSISRGQGVLLTVHQTQLLAPSIKALQYDKERQDILGEIIHNRRVVYAQSLASNYLSHFNPLWLFFTGDEVSRHHAPGFGLLYLVSLPFIIAGIYFLLSRTFSSSWIIFVWFLLAPIAASLTFEAPHALRSLIFLPTWQIFEAAGVLFLFQSINKKRFAIIIKVLVVILFAGNIFYYLHQYFVHTNTDFQKDWQYGYKEAIDTVAAYHNTDKRIIFSKSFEQPYIFYLFYAKYDSAKYIATGSSWRTSQKCYTIDNAYFGDCSDKLRSGDILVVTGNDVPANTKELKKITYYNGDPATIIYLYK
jgi:4-amino-4-deoxy-L-arabinose transferase-like glycosyltransferase